MYTECKANALLYSTTFVRNVFCLKKYERATRRNARRSSYKVCYLSSNFDRNWNCVTDFNEAPVYTISRWKDDAENDVRKMGIVYWTQVAQDRDGWRTTREALILLG